VLLESVWAWFFLVSLRRLWPPDRDREDGIRRRSSPSRRRCFSQENVGRALLSIMNLNRIGSVGNFPWSWGSRLRTERRAICEIVKNNNQTQIKTFTSPIWKLCLCYTAKFSMPTSYSHVQNKADTVTKNTHAKMQILQKDPKIQPTRSKAQPKCKKWEMSVSLLYNAFNPSFLPLLL